MTVARALAGAALLSALGAWSVERSAPQTLRYSIFMSDRLAGSEVDVFYPDGHVESSYEYNDRGRGPKVSAHYALGPEGFITSARVTGVDYFKAPVDERFAVDGGVSGWSSTSEHGQASDPGFYVSINGPTVEAALLLSALVRAKGAPVRLFPAGEARLERLGDTTLSSNGRTVHVTEYAISGLSFEPVTLWVDDDLQLFAVPAKWQSIRRDGWEASNDELYELGRKADDARYARLAKQLSRHPGRPVSFEHVRLFDSEKALVRTDQTVVVDGAHIAQVGPAGTVQVPSGAERIDGKGKTLLPGLFDMHTHLGPVQGLLHIAGGVTTVRDLGNDPDIVRHLDEQWTDETAIGPRIWKAGIIDGAGPYQVPTGFFARTEEEAVSFVNRYADLGYVQIKLYSSIDPAWVPAIVKAAHRRGLRVSGHVPNGMTAAGFVAAGADELQHINFVFLNFLAGQVKDTRTPERFTAVAEKAATLDLESASVNSFVKLLQARRVPVDVTLAVFENMFTARPGQASPSFLPVLERLPPQVQREAFTGGLAVTPATDQLYKDSYAAMLRMTKKMYDAGIPILVGTDATGGIFLHRELELEVKAGIPPTRALQNATFLAARVLKQQRTLGSVAVGKLADLVLVEGDPTVEISDIRRTRIVVKGGTMYDVAAVDRAVGIAPSR